jgi:hypothetical protein
VLPFNRDVQITARQAKLMKAACMYMMKVRLTSVVAQRSMCASHECTHLHRQHVYIDIHCFSAKACNYCILWYDARTCCHLHITLQADQELVGATVTMPCYGFLCCLG